MVGRRTFAAVVAVVTTGALVPVAQAAQVTIVPPRGGSAITLTDLQLETVQGTYEVPGEPVPVSGATIPDLIDAAFVEAAKPDPDLQFDPTYSYAAISGAGQSLLLSRDQIAGAGDSPPIVWWDEQGTYLASPDGGRVAASSIEIELRSRSQLEVKIKATKVRVKPGEPVTFEARVLQSGAGQELEFSWTVVGGAREAGSDTFTHRFEERGEYDVTLGVKAPGDETGAFDVVRIKVGQTSKKGPDRKGGGTNDATDAPDSGSAAGGAAGRAAGGSAGGAGGSDGSSGSSGGESGPAPASATVVSGELLSGVSGSPRSSLGQALRSALRTGSAPPKVATEGLGVPGVAGGLTAALVLLGLGAALELRHGHRSRLRPSRG